MTGDMEGQMLVGFFLKYANAFLKVTKMWHTVFL